MTVTIEAIYRYPVKGLSAEPMTRVALSPGECLPQDRRFAIALATTRFDPTRPEWLSKTHFLMLMRDERLAALESEFDPATDTLTIRRAGRVVVAARLTEPQGCQSVCTYLADFLGPGVPTPLRVVAATGHAFADARRQPDATSDKYVSLINRASIAALEAAERQVVDPLRFRANVYFNGAPAWSELGWIGEEIGLGEARLRIVSTITRCAATEVNPATAERDLDVSAALQRGFGHNLMGVYGEVVAGGEIAVGDQLAPPRSPGVIQVR